MAYLYCGNTDCGTYLGSLGGEHCKVCEWKAPEEEEDIDENISNSSEGKYLTWKSSCFCCK